MRLLFFGLLALTALGCSGEPPVYEVRGVVTFEGEPLDHGTVRFYKNGGSPVSASGISPAGAFELEAVAGNHRVTVESPPTFDSDPTATGFEGGIAPDAKPTGKGIPPIYADIGTTPLEFEIGPDKEGVINIELTSPESRR